MEDQDDDAALLKVAEAVSDGNPVDWDAAQSRHDEAEIDLAHLQALEGVAAAFRATRQDMESSGSTSAGPFSASARGSDDPHALDLQRRPKDGTPSGWRRSGIIRAAALGTLALAALYLAARLLWNR
jgi:hypothetical protein